MGFCCFPMSSMAATETLINGDMTLVSSDGLPSSWRAILPSGKGGEGKFEWTQKDGVDQSPCMLVDIIKDGTAINAFQMQQSIQGLNNVVGDKYILSFDAKVEGVPQYKINRIWLREVDKNANVSNNQTITVEGDTWKRYTVELETTVDHHSTLLTLQFGNNKVENAKLYFDNFSLLSPRGVTPTATQKPVATQAPAEDEKYELPSEAKSSFDDCNTHWAITEIEIMKLQGVINGKSDRLFAPEDNITRAEFLALVTRAVGMKSGSYNNCFSDITPDKWYASTVQAAYDNGFINPGMIENNNFQGEKTITREEMTSMIAAGYKMLAGKDADAVDISHFKDMSGISAWALEDVKKAYGLSIIKGITETTFEPKTNATRAQAAVMISRLYDYKEKIINDGFDEDKDSWAISYRTAAVKEPKRNAEGTVARIADDGNLKNGCILFDMAYTGKNQVNTIQWAKTIGKENGANIIEKDKNYLVTFYAKLEGVDAFPINVIKFRDVDNNDILHSTTGAFVGVTSGGWKKYYVLVTGTQTQPVTKLIFQAGGCSQKNVKFYLDDIAVTEAILQNNINGTVAQGFESIGQVVGSGTYQRNSVAGLKAVSDVSSGYLFDAWRDNYGNAVDQNSAHDCIVQNDRSIVANFKPYTAQDKGYGFNGAGDRNDLDATLTCAGDTATVNAKLSIPAGTTLLEAGAIFYNECYKDNFNIFSDGIDKVVVDTVSSDGSFAVTKAQLNVDDDVLSRAYAIYKDSNNKIYIEYSPVLLENKKSGEMKPYKLITNYEMMAGYTDNQITDYDGTDVEMITITPCLYRTNMWRSEIDTQWKDYVHGESGEVGGDLQKRVETIMSDLKSGRDLFEEKVTLAKEHGLDVYANYRMNDSHRTENPHSQTHNRFYYQNPQYWLNNNGDTTGNKTLNYMEEAVRDFYFGLVSELVTNYDVDGLELDLQRAPYFFENDEIQNGKSIMTEFIMRVRAMLDRVGKQKGKYLPLSVRISPSVEKANAVGFDVDLWDEMKLIDYFNISPSYFNDLEIDLESYMEVVDNAKIYGEIEYVVEDDGGKRQFCQPEILWATAANFYARGVDGITMFNMNYSGDIPGTYSAFKEMADEEDIKDTEKLYVMMSSVSGHTLPQRGKFSYELLIADDIQGGIFKSSMFRVQTSKPHNGMKIDVYINGVKLEEAPVPEGETELFPRLTSTRNNAFYPEADRLRYYKVPIDILKKGTNTFSFDTSTEDGGIQIAQTGLALYK